MRDGHLAGAPNPFTSWLAAGTLTPKGQSLVSIHAQSDIPNDPGRDVAGHGSRVDASTRPLDGPVIAALAKRWGPNIAALDAAWAAMVLAGGARDAAELLDWLQMTGLLDAPPYWCAA
jgi:hypothetical protein